MVGIVSNKDLQNTLDNIIRREVGCFTDEVIEADIIYCISDQDIPPEIEDLVNRLDSVIIQDLDDVDFNHLADNNLLIILSKNGCNEEFEKTAKRFKETGSRVIALTANRKGSFADYTHEILGVNISSKKYNKLSDKDVFWETATILLKKVYQKREKLLKNLSLK